MCNWIQIDCVRFCEHTACITGSWCWECCSGVWWLPWLGNMLARSLTKLDCGCQQRTDLSILCPKWTAQDSQMLHSLVGFKVHEALPSPGSLYLEGWICWCSSCLRFWLIASQDFPQHLMFFRLKVCHQLDCIHPMMSFARLRGKGVDFHSPDISRCSILWYCLLSWSSLAAANYQVQTHYHLQCVTACTDWRIRTNCGNPGVVWLQCSDENTSLSLKLPVRRLAARSDRSDWFLQGSSPCWTFLRVQRAALRMFLSSEQHQREAFFWDKSVPDSFEWSCGVLRFFFCTIYSSCG